MITPKIREILYAFGLLAFAVLTVLSTLRIIDGTVAASVSAALTAILGLFGVTVSGTAAYQVRKQIKTGTFEATDPADQVIRGVNAVVEQAQMAQSEVNRVTQVLTDAVEDATRIPVLGPLAKQALDMLNRR